MTNGTSIFDSIERDHRVVRLEFEAIEAAPKAAVRRRERHYARLRAELKRHSEAEDRVLYPFLQRRRETAELTAASAASHDRMDAFIEEIDAHTADSDEWNRSIRKLRAEFDEHVAQEEGEIFVKMRRNFTGEDLSALAQKYAEARRHAGERNAA